MIKVTDLMIGDWVSINGSNYKVRDIKKKGVIKLYEDTQWGEHEIEFSSDSLEEFLQPIPLTPEILEKNGFVRDMQEEKKLKSILTENFRGFYEIPNIPDKYVGFYLESWNDELYTITDHQLIKIHYVHELQHVLKLCGIKKEIVL